MNEYVIEEWIRASRESRRATFLREHFLDDRVLRLFSIACCREIWDSLTDERSKRTVEIAELYADGLVDEEELIRARENARDVCRPADNLDDETYITFASGWTVTYTASAAACVTAAATANRQKITYKQQGLILASMCPTYFSKQWTTLTATALAQRIYDKKEFELMPILADALQDINCDDEEILNNLRGTGPFYKGHYIIDKLIGKR